MQSVNLAMIEGQVGLSPQPLESERLKVKFTVATTNEDTEDLDWHTIIAEGQVAGFVLENLKRKDSVFVRGRFKSLPSRDGSYYNYIKALQVVIK